MNNTPINIVNREKALQNNPKYKTRTPTRINTGITTMQKKNNYAMLCVYNDNDRNMLCHRLYWILVFYNKT